MYQCFSRGCSRQANLQRNLSPTGKIWLSKEQVKSIKRIKPDLTVWNFGRSHTMTPVLTSWHSPTVTLMSAGILSGSGRGVRFFSPRARFTPGVFGADTRFLGSTLGLAFSLATSERRLLSLDGSETAARRSSSVSAVAAGDDAGISSGGGSVASGGSGSKLALKSGRCASGRLEKVFKKRAVYAADAESRTTGAGASSGAAPPAWLSIC